MKKPEVFHVDEIPADIAFSLPGFNKGIVGQIPKKAFGFIAKPPSFQVYRKSFEKVMGEINHGNSYLLNLTFKSKIDTNMDLREIFEISRAKYKLWFRNQFVVFSPETFVQIKNGFISSFPMKGTIDATIPDAENILLKDGKEAAEHNTIVDLIRNDLAMVSQDVFVEKFKYIEKLQTHKGGLLQMSSKISGKLPEDYLENLGGIIMKLLPAGSITGAPKPETVRIIRETENYERGYYTGIFGYFDGENLDSAVMIRFIERVGEDLFFKSGGGITSLSEMRKEYDELIQKIYVPIHRNHQG